MQFTQKSDTEAAPERGRSGKPSVYRPKVDITIDSRNIETPPRSRERSPKIPELRRVRSGGGIGRSGGVVVPYVR
jgi:hypothetical protein